MGGMGGMGGMPGMPGMGGMGGMPGMSGMGGMGGMTQGSRQGVDWGTEGYRRHLAREMLDVLPLIWLKDLLIGTKIITKTLTNNILHHVYIFIQWCNTICNENDIHMLQWYGFWLVWFYGNGDARTMGIHFNLGRDYPGRWFHPTYWA